MADNGEASSSAAPPAEELSAEKKAQKEAKAAAKKAEKEAKKQKALEKQKKLDAAKVAQQANAGKKAEAKAAAKAKADAKAAELQAKLDKVLATPTGEKKDLSDQPPDAYHPKYVEAAWYQWWSKSGFFKPDMDSDAEPFVIVIPPPNVTGALHIGHALTNAVQDAVVRYQRMKGRNALWVPGTDHAGIATQTVVEKKVMREQSKTRHDLGREGFLKEVHAYVKEYGNTILEQQQAMGISVDWDRQAFTMDANLSRAVLEAFVRLYQDGLIYRENRLVNWCCKLRTAVSDIEVEYIDVEKATLLPVPGYTEPVEFGAIVSFAYPIDTPGEGAPAEVVVATTRIETMLGDAAVAVHPDDPRYSALHGKHAVHPVDGRKIPIILDAELVDMEFGTGAVKITPAHDPNDFKAGQRHGLPMVNIFDDAGSINENGGQFAGQPRFTARRTVVEFLQEKGLYRGKADNKMALPQCSRSKDIIEPMLKPQWWVDCQEMGAAACTAARDGSLQILPSDFEATWFRWLENIRDWCISRQLWWGHRIPAWYVVKSGEAEDDAGVPGAPSEQPSRWVVGRNEEEARAAAKAKFPDCEFELHQDEDVLDTWFSSGLFPFSVFQWPQETADLAKFYPGALLETGHDILFFWVARMVMMGMKLTGQVPFKQVYLHAMVRDAHGRKMSKSLGNVINPLDVIHGISLEGLHGTLQGGNLDPREVEKAQQGQRADFPEGIEECGTDALRFALCAYTAQGRDINLDIKRVVAYRHWCNKLWNAIKFGMLTLGDAFVPAADPRAGLECPEGATAAAVACRWLLSRLHAAAEAADAGFEAYDFATTTQSIYAFWQYDVCDMFIEIAKPIVRGDDAAAAEAVKQTLYTALEAGLRLLHPFMPFVTEELWQRLPRREGTTAASIMVARYPTAERLACRDEAAEAEVARLQGVVKEARAAAAAKGLKPNQAAEMSIACKDADARQSFEAHGSIVTTLVANCSALCVLPADAPAPAGAAASILDSDTTLYLHLKGLLDPQAEIAKLQKQRSAAETRASTLEGRMAMPAYDNTPADRKEVDRTRLAEARAEVGQVDALIAEMQALAADAA
eukprot:jgi/Ulvmu1/3658/UM017_0072.1